MMGIEEQRRLISSAIEYLEQAKDELYSITIDYDTEDEVDEFINDVAFDIQEVIDKLDPEKDEEED